ncbi:MAG: hypothetical protein PHC51_07495 [bacterium]|nr:hypothetical protein [bacterium]
MATYVVKLFDGRELTYPCTVFFEYIGEDENEKKLRPKVHYAGRIDDVGPTPEGFKFQMRGVQRVISRTPTIQLGVTVHSLFVLETNIRIYKIKVHQTKS